MQRMIGIAGLIAALAACTGSGDLTGNDNGSFLEPGDPVIIVPDTDSPSPSPDPPDYGTDVLLLPGCVDADPNAPTTLAATGGENQVNVVAHLSGEPNAEWSVWGVVGDQRLVLNVDSLGTGSNAACLVELAFTMPNLYAGEWVVELGDLTATATVTGQSAPAGADSSGG